MTSHGGGACQDEGMEGGATGLPKLKNKDWVRPEPDQDQGQVQNQIRFFCVCVIKPHLPTAGGAVGHCTGSGGLFLKHISDYFCK